MGDGGRRGNPATVARAESLDRLVQTDPRAALVDARRWFAESADDDDAACQAQAAAARALFELGQHELAVDAIRGALELCERSSADVRLPIAMSAAAILADAGDVDGALDELERLLSDAAPRDRGRLRSQRAYVLLEAGRLNESIAEADRAEPLLTSTHDELGWLRLLVLRGTVQLQRGRFGEAHDDLRAADELAASLGQQGMRAGIASNIGVVYGRTRRIRDALIQFDLARELHASVGQPGRMAAISEIDRAEVLMHAGLVVDAVDAASLAVRQVERSGNLVVIGDSMLVLARAQLAAGDTRQAERTAAVAESMLHAGGRRRMVAHAAAVGALAALERAVDADAARDALDAATVVAAQLVDSGWEQHALELRVARLRSGRRHRLRDEILDDVKLVSDLRVSGQRDAELAGWYGAAVERWLADDSPGAMAACRTGLDIVDDVMAEAPTLEERSAAMRLGTDLSTLTIELAVEVDDPDVVFAAAEGTRARALHDELVVQERHRSFSLESANDLQRQVATRLQDGALVEWVVAGPDLHAVIVDDGGARLVHLGSIREVVRARDRVLAWIDRAAFEPDASSANVRRAAEVLDEIVIAPLGLPAHGQIVIVPDGVLHEVPWSALPSLAHRSVALAPNAQLWLAADRRSTTRVRSTGLVVGPEVRAVDIERAAVERAHPDGATAAGPGATAATVRSMFAGLDMVHVAAHGRFRSDHPLLSTLRLHDGESTLYDVVPERVATRLVVLSSCEAGAQVAAEGSEVLGFAAVMLARGAGAVIAPLTVVRDDSCAEFIADVHRELATGRVVGHAVAHARSRWLTDRDHDHDLGRWAVCASFACFGSGSVAIATA